MLDLISRLRSDERGATATEYAMLIVFVALAIAVGDGLAISDLPFNGIAAKGNAVQTAGVITAICLLGVVAYSDLRRRRIPNALCLGIAALGLVRIALTGD